MDAWIKIVVVLMLMSAMSLVVGYLIFDPFVGLILLGVILTLMIMTLDPATGKAMAQVIIPIVIILFVFQVFLYPGDIAWWMPFVVGAVLYILFILFTGGGGSLEGGIIDAGVSIKLFPLYGLAIFLSALADPTRKTTVYIMVGTVSCLMILYMAFLRNYDKWPLYSYEQSGVITLTDINPRGKVKAGAEIWWAKTTGPPIKEGERAIVKGVTGLTMIVAKEGLDAVPGSEQ